ncbi:Rieske (2Fe-2S) protein [soil metagenome]
MPSEQPSEQPALSRQQFLGSVAAGGAALALTACSTDDGGAGAGAGDRSSGSAVDPQVLATTADVPVGSGIIVEDTVLTQPNSGEFKGFSNLCTHAGCRLNEVSDGTVNCPCHGSKFNLDGSVARGPATTPLEVKAITVQGDSILAG